MIRVYHGQGGAEPIKVLDALHMKPVSLIKVSSINKDSKQAVVAFKYQVV